MKIPSYIQSYISLAANRYAQLKDQYVLFVSESKNKEYEIKQTYFGVEKFPHLIAMTPKNCTPQDFFLKCQQGQLTYNDFDFTKGHNINDVESKARTLVELLNYKHLKMFKYGNFKSGINKNIQSIRNQYDIGIGTNKGIIGYIKNRGIHSPKTTLIDKIEKLMPYSNPVVTILSKSSFNEKYNEIFSELYQGKYAEVSHSLNPQKLRIISIPNMDRQYKLNIIKLIDSLLNDILPKDIFDKNLIISQENIKLAFKNAVLSNVDGIAKWLNNEIGNQQGTTLLLTASVDEIVYTRQISNAINESTNVINFELMKDTNKIGFSVKSAKPSLEKKDLIQHLAEGYILIDINTLDSMANITEKDFEKYFKDDYILVSEVKSPFVIVKKEDLLKIPIHIPSLDDIIAEKSKTTDLNAQTISFPTRERCTEEPDSR